MTLDLDRYLQRIGLARVTPTEDGLEALHRAQVYAIPFENFDILLGRGVTLDPAHLVGKLVGRRRGGYCFELNALLGMALAATGFEVRPLLARVELPGRNRQRTHGLNLVHLDGRDWIADGGFGSTGLRAPLPLEHDRTATQDGVTYRLTGAGAAGTMLQLAGDDGWQDLYSFTLEQVRPVDIEIANHYTATHPDSVFTRTRIASLPNPDGRVLLRDFELRRIDKEAETAIELEPGPAYLDALRTEFDIDLDVPYDALRR